MLLVKQLCDIDWIDSRARLMTKRKLSVCLCDVGDEDKKTWIHEETMERSSLMSINFGGVLSDCENGGLSQHSRILLNDL